MYPPNLTLEERLWEKGRNYIVGIDEVGRGSWAGPLVAAGVILPKDFEIPTGFADSKQLSAKKREKFDLIIKSVAVACVTAEISHSRINKIGVGEATQNMFRKIATTIRPAADFILVDAFHIKYMPESKQRAIKFGDRISASIAAASIVAKVHRDELMKRMSQKYPRYGFDSNKGYGTKMHQAAIKKYGFCTIHRTSYRLRFLS